MRQGRGGLSLHSCRRRLAQAMRMLPRLRKTEGCVAEGGPRERPKVAIKPGNSRGIRGEFEGIRNQKKEFRHVSIPSGRSISGKS